MNTQQRTREDRLEEEEEEESGRYFYNYYYVCRLTQKGPESVSNHARDASYIESNGSNHQPLGLLAGMGRRVHLPSF